MLNEVVNLNVLFALHFVSDNEIFVVKPIEHCVNVGSLTKRKHACANANRPIFQSAFTICEYPQADEQQ